MSRRPSEGFRSRLKALLNLGFVQHGTKVGIYCFYLVLSLLNLQLVVVVKKLLLLSNWLVVVLEWLA